MSQQMAPTLTANYLADGLGRDAVLGGQISVQGDAALEALANLDDLSVRQLSAAMVFALVVRDEGASFINHVPHVGVLVAQEQVSVSGVLNPSHDIDSALVVAGTGSNITGVQYLMPDWNGSPGGESPSDFMRHLDGATNAHLSVAGAGISSALPQPAPVVIRADIGEEASRQVAGLERAHTLVRAEAHWSVREPGALHQEGRLAHIADAFNTRERFRPRLAPSGGTIRLHRTSPPVSSPGCSNSAGAYSVKYTSSLRVEAA